jgi:hypothetical protein
LPGNLKGKEQPEKLDADGRINLKWYGNRVGRCGLYSSGSG